HARRRPARRARRHPELGHPEPDLAERQELLRPLPGLRLRGDAHLRHPPRPHGAPAQGARSAVVAPFLFLAIFVEGMSNSFMPQHLQRLAAAQGVSTSIVSTHFTVYYAALAFALLPVGRFIESGRMKSILILAAAIEALSLLSMALVGDIYVMFAVRAAAGAA